MALATSSIGIDSAVFVLRNRRMGHSEAIDYLKNEIVMLLQHATLYSLSVMLRLVLQRYVFMLNSLTVPALPACLCTRADDLPQLPAGTAIKHASPGCFGHLTKANNQVDSSDKAPALPATVQLVHDISTLQPWHDGLEPLQSLLAPPLSEDAIDSIPATAMPDSLPIQSFEDWEWYMNLVQLPRSADMQKQGPPSHISVSSLLEVLGVGPTTMPQIQQHLRREHEALLREAVLPRFIDTLISCIDKQIPGIDLRAQHAKTPFLRGTASGSCTPGNAVRPQHHCVPHRMYEFMIHARPT